MLVKKAGINQKGGGKEISRKNWSDLKGQGEDRGEARL